MPKVSIVILNYNGKRFLNDCISSVLKQDFTDYEIILVDNNSSDGSADFIREKFLQIKLIQSDKNLGFAGGNNLGVNHSSGELIVLLNNDTVTKDNWLKNLVAAVDKDNVAIASPLILNEHTPMKYWERKGSINFLGHNIMLVFSKEEEIFSSSGACLIYKKDLLGIPFDEDYFAYSEDVYLGLRARFMGYEIHHTNNSEIYHFEGGSFNRTPNQLKTFIQERNRLLNMFLFFSLKTNLKLIPIYLFNIITKLSVALIFGWHKKYKKYSLPGLLQAYFWFIRNISLVLNKRKKLASQKSINEKNVIKFMTYKLDNGESLPGKFINYMAKIYFTVVNIRTYEFYHDSSTGRLNTTLY
ncbi:MAG: glycosyltransferase [Ignavibacteriales bacterium]|nr:MAG: glycosyltransferase [Ignavibacteriales bacterium]